MFLLHHKVGSNSDLLYQFLDAVCVSRWLCLRLGMSKTDALVVQDCEALPPTQVARQLLAAAIALGVSTGELSEVSSTALARGQGLGVCLYLNALASRCLVGWHASPPKYIEEVHARYRL
jgi:hypothetical protein